MVIFNSYVWHTQRVYPGMIGKLGMVGPSALPTLEAAASHLNR